jgi:hypothetical protein
MHRCFDALAPNELAASEAAINAKMSHRRSLMASGGALVRRRRGAVVIQKAIALGDAQTLALARAVSGTEFLSETVVRHEQQLITRLRSAIPFAESFEQFSCCRKTGTGLELPTPNA